MVSAVGAFRAGFIFGATIFTTLAVLGAWSFATFPLRFFIDEEGITVVRPMGTRLVEWSSVDHITRLPGSFRFTQDERGRRSVSRRGGPLVALVKRNRVVLSSAREDPLIRNAVVEAALRRGVSVSPNV